MVVDHGDRWPCGCIRRPNAIALVRCDNHFQDDTEPETTSGTYECIACGRNTLPDNWYCEKCLEEMAQEEMAKDEATNNNQGSRVEPI